MLLSKLIKHNQSIWDEYLFHPFVLALQDQSLPMENFLFYLKQDYLYLLSYAKCGAKLALKARNVDELRFALSFCQSIMQGELALHQSVLAKDLAFSKLGPKDESLTTIAYTRYLLSLGDVGDFLDLLVGISSCAIGYGYIGARLGASLTANELENHCYKEWILTYSNEAFQAEIKAFEDFLNHYSPMINQSKLDFLQEIFYMTTKLETQFWQHALDLK